MGKWVKSLEVLDKLDKMLPSEDFTYNSTKNKINWTGTNYKVILNWNEDTITIQCNEDWVVIENTFWEADSTEVDQYELNVDRFVEKVVEVINQCKLKSHLT